ncbi:MAG: hypothetical protein E7254_07615 [Lachnospiraceae bacterium]|nr:hypothetical protein [Lachnospiraceae bacterium]
MAYYEVEKGDNSNRIDLFFDEKPSDEILQELKSSGWRWYGYNRCWYSYDSEQHREQAEKICELVNDEYDWLRDSFFSRLEEYGEKLSMSNADKIHSLAKKKVSKIDRYYSGKKYNVEAILKDIKSRKAVAVARGNGEYNIYFIDEVIVFTKSDRTSSQILTDKKGKMRTIIASSMEEDFKKALKSNAKYFSIDESHVEINDDEYEKIKEEFLELLEDKYLYLDDEVVVKQNTFNCDDSGHHIEDFCGIINVLNRNTELEKHKIWVGYCCECEEFFVMKNEFLAISQKGVLLCNIKSETMYNEYNPFENAGNLNDESILKQYGYCVGKNSPLTLEQRRAILSLLIDSNIISRSKILSLLNYFIEMRNNSKKDFSQAISDWESDIKYVSNYKLSEKSKKILKHIRSKW